MTQEKLAETSDNVWSKTLDVLLQIEDVKNPCREDSLDEYLAYISETTDIEWFVK